ncbi:hypothetical protein AB0Y20_00640 [Heyndrickxia oleronia]|uniref:hypothetical protein n=1 Tax=Heyndrickxia oleronia TaxID=38875 RepID=UPI003F28D9E6
MSESIEFVELIRDIYNRIEDLEKEVENIKTKTPVADEIFKQIEKRIKSESQR